MKRNSQSCGPQKKASLFLPIRIARDDQALAYNGIESDNKYGVLRQGVTLHKHSKMLVF